MKFLSTAASHLIIECITVYLIRQEVGIFNIISNELVSLHGKNG
jgi:hypothetical protein